MPSPPKMKPLIRATDGSILPRALTWAIVLLCCGLPLIWIPLQLLTNAHALRELQFDSFRIQLLARTLLYNGAASLIALMLALPVAMVLGRGVSVLSRALWVVLPIALLLPSLAMTYGWKQFFRLIGIDFDPAGAGDTLRCIWTLAAWLWPIPAGVIGLSLRRMDIQVQEQAILDGHLWRSTFRHLLPAIIASFCIVMVLAVQEFAIYEPSGISVLATEVRMVFDTGSLSSADNPINQQLGFGAAIGGSAGLQDQRARSAAAVAVYAPMIVVILLLAGLATFLARRSASSESLDLGRWPRSLNAPAGMPLLAWFVVLLTIAAPVLAMILSLKQHSSFLDLWTIYRPQLLGSFTIAAVTALVAAALSILASVSPSPRATTVALLSFLIGGQMLAIALIRIYNRPWLGWIYNEMPMIVIAHLSRFAWIALIAGNATFSSAWKTLRDNAAVDGASRWQTARRIVLPIAAPLIAASALLILALSLTEVPATVLISPQHPQPILPMLMTWVHMLRYDAMIQCSLLLCALVSLLGLAALVLFKLSSLKPQINTDKHGSGKRKISVHLCSSVVPFLLILISGCEDPAKPSEIWLETGNGPGQTVYPRAIAFDPLSNSFFLCDRMARVQHLDINGQFLNEWRMPDHGLGKPVGISVGPDGNVYVPDTHYHRVMVYSPKGDLLRQWGSLGNDPGQFIYPTDIAFDDKGRIFVGEYGDHDRISVFDMSGKYLYEIGKFGFGDGEFSRPQSIVIEGDTLYTADTCNHRIAVFKTDGTFVRNMGGPGSGLGEFRFPYGLDLDKRTNQLVVCEFGNNRVQWIDKDSGRGIKTFGAPGRAPGELAYPWAAIVDGKGRTIIVDSGNNRLQVLKK